MLTKPFAIATALLTALPLSAVADERNFKNTTLECAFVVFNNSQLETRFPDLNPETEGGNTQVTVKNGVEVKYTAYENSCLTWDKTVPLEAAKELLPDIIHGMRLTDTEDTHYGRGTPAIRGLFNKTQPYLVIYQSHVDGGTAIQIRPE